MSSLFEIVAKKISTENLAIDAKMVPRTILVNIRIRSFHKLYSKLPAFPDECFVFAKDWSINLQRTFERAERVVDPVDVFTHYMEHRNLEWMKSAWGRLDKEQQARICSSDDEVKQALSEYLKTGVPPPDYRLFALYQEARVKNFHLSVFLWKMGTVEFQKHILLGEFCRTLQFGHSDQWASNCEQLAGLVALQGFDITLGKMDWRSRTELKQIIRLMPSVFLELPENCRIPAIEDLAAASIDARVPMC
uniref:ATP synthase subunit alpha, mitochondrial n=1 Tax=Steinernema glaseri TaxID=37863 RepID=A0A1I7YWM8_9BILA